MDGSTSSWCARCGRQLYGGDRTCPGCGAPVPQQWAAPPLQPTQGTGGWPAPPAVPLAPQGATWSPAPGPSSWGAPPGWENQAAGPAWGPQPPRVPDRASSKTWLYIAVPAAVVVLAAVVVGALLLSSRTNNDTAAPPSADDGVATASGVVGGATAGAGGGAGQGAGAITGPLDSYASASAPATSADSVDGAGARTSYEASHLLDGDPTTAWRMDGDGTGAVLTFTLDTARPITTLGLINGYAKTDPVTGEDRYAENRRILAVTWSIGGRTIEQDLIDGTGQVQAVTFPAVTAAIVRLRIDAVTVPGEARFDHTVISDVLIAG